MKNAKDRLQLYIHVSTYIIIVGIFFIILAVHYKSTGWWVAAAVTIGLGTWKFIESVKFHNFFKLPKAYYIKNQENYIFGVVMTRKKNSEQKNQTWVEIHDLNGNTLYWGPESELKADPVSNEQFVDHLKDKVYKILN